MNPRPLLSLLLPLILLSGCHRKHKTLEERIRFTRDGLVFTAIITRPATSGTRYPAFLVLDGPGEEDIDRSTFAFKKTIRPLQDLANRLAAKGAVVLRFSKRTALPGEDRARFQFAKLTPDARAALDILLKQRMVDPMRVSLIAFGRALPLAINLSKAHRFYKVFLLGPVFSRIDRHIRFKLHYQLDFYNRHQLRHRLKPLINRTRQMLATTGRAIPLMHDPEIPPDKKILGYPKGFWSDWIRATKNLETKAQAIRTPLYLLYGTRDLENPSQLLLQRTLNLRKKSTVRVKSFKGMRHDLYHNPTGSFMTQLSDYISKTL